MAVMDRDSVKQTIKEAVDIVDLVSQYTTLAPAGKRMKGISPFTNEKTPSFFVDPEEGLYYCFSSQKGGDVFTFVQEVEGVDFKEALKLLGDRVGIDVQASAVKKENNAGLYHLLESAAVLYQRHLTDKSREYLKARGNVRAVNTGVGDRVRAGHVEHGMYRGNAERGRRCAERYVRAERILNI